MTTDIEKEALNPYLEKKITQSEALNALAKPVKKQAEDIAKQKMKDLNANDLVQATKIICGSARSMGIEVKE